MSVNLIVKNYGFYFRCFLFIFPVIHPYCILQVLVCIGLQILKTLYVVLSQIKRSTGGNVQPELEDPPLQSKLGRAASGGK